MAIMVLTSKDPNDTWIILIKWYHNIIRDKILLCEGIIFQNDTVIYYKIENELNAIFKIKLFHLNYLFFVIN